MLLVAAVWGPLDLAVTLAAPALAANPLVVLLGPVAWLASKAVVVGLTVWVWYSARRVVRKRVLVDTWIAALAAVGAVPVGFTAAVLAGAAV